LPTHVGNHHRYANQRGDWTLTWRTGEGMHLGNWALYTLIGLMLYVVGALRYLGRSLVRRPVHGLACLLQLGVVVALITVAWWSDPLRAWWLIAVPWLFGLIAMVATGYLQHHHTDADSPWRNSRDFTGRLNNLLHFNHGYHGVHHVDPTLHWSEWPAAHALVADQRDPTLEEASLPRFLLRTFLAAPFLAVLRRVRPALRSPS
jgi:fatty acid desaturase